MTESQKSREIDVDSIEEFFRSQLLSLMSVAELLGLSSEFLRAVVHVQAVFICTTDATSEQKEAYVVASAKALRTQIQEVDEVISKKKALSELLAKLAGSVQPKDAPPMH